MGSALRRFVDCQSGATSIEYGMIAMLISIAILGVLQGVGSNLTSTYTSVNSAFSH